MGGGCGDASRGERWDIWRFSMGGKSNVVSKGNSPTVMASGQLDWIGMGAQVFAGPSWRGILVLASM